MRAAASSVAVAPTEVSTTNRIASAVDIAYSACAATDACKPVAVGSQPPVSITVNFRPFQRASYVTRSRVTPGTSSTTASRRPRIRFTRVDLPTFGRPTTATTGGGATSCSTGTSIASACWNSLTGLAPRGRLAGPGARLSCRIAIGVGGVLARDAQDLLDDLVEAEAGRVELDRVRRLRERVDLTCGVEAVTAGQVGLGRGDRDAGELGAAALCPRLGARREVDLDLGVRR